MAFPVKRSRLEDAYNMVFSGLQKVAFNKFNVELIDPVSCVWPCVTRARLQHRCRSNRPAALSTMSSVYLLEPGSRKAAPHLHVL